MKLKAELKRQMVVVILILIFCLNILSTAVGQENSENNQPVSDEGFFTRFITYVKNMFSGEGELQAQQQFQKQARKVCSNPQILRQRF